MTNRKETWVEALDAFLCARKDAPFAWGENDCCLFVADAVEVMTGVDPAAEFRDKYTDEASALAAIKAVCGGFTTEDAIAYVAQQQGWARLDSVLLAQRGDMVMIDSGSGMAAGIVHLDGRSAVFVSETGLRRVPVRQCVSAWRVS